MVNSSYQARKTAGGVFSGLRFCGIGDFAGIV